MGNEAVIVASSLHLAAACQVLMDTSYTDTIMHAPCCDQQMTTMTTITFQCTGDSKIIVEIPTSLHAQLQALVLSEAPLVLDVLVSMTGIESLGVVIVRSSSGIQFCGAQQWGLCGAVT